MIHLPIVLGALSEATQDERNYGPGFLGFAVLFGLALAVFLLMRSMTGRIRRLRYSSQDQEADLASGRPGRISIPVVDHTDPS